MASLSASAKHVGAYAVPPSPPPTFSRLNALSLSLSLSTTAQPTINQADSLPADLSCARISFSDFRTVHLIHRHAHKISVALVSELQPLLTPLLPLLLACLLACLISVALVSKSPFLTPLLPLSCLLA